MTQNKIIAVTGGIGSGKSTALKIISELGYPTFSCDDYTQTAYNSGDTVIKLKEYFPSAFVKGELDRKTLSNIVFNDKEKYNILSELVTKKIFSLVMEDAKKQSGIVFVEVPLLFEFNLQDEFDGVFVILRQLEKRVSSVVERSKISREEVFERIKKQFDYSDRKFLDGFTVIEHYGEMDELKEKVVSAIRKL